MISNWLAGDSTLDPSTAIVWETYGRHWLKTWPTLIDVTEITVVDYRNERLRKVQAQTVRKELGALKRFLKWCHDRHFIPIEIKMPGVPTKVTGTAHAKRRRVSADELSPDQIERIIEALPEWSKLPKRRTEEDEPKRFPIRARFRVQYETGLRPSTIEALSVPEHYSKGQDFLNITADIDKVRWARQVPLTPQARAALDACCPPKGVLFGGHDLREAIAKAAATVLPTAAAKRFAGAHLRSARVTHLLEATGDLPGVQFQVGHRQASTTAKYAKPSERAARSMLAKLAAIGGQSANSGDKPNRKPKSKKKIPSDISAKERT
ncbi:MAG TPA: tyrosine-type recombinase/integrase [Polyangiaceae bacterium]|nr:tyrosine-type recombinase/integrase [Polyangiaceae bacterium]